jgi:CRISPR-associated protein (TIGR02710 family)
MEEEVAGTFEEKLRQLQRISDGVETYGGGKRYEQGTRYYLEHLVHECARRARTASPWLPGEVDLLISMTGHSPRLTILAYEILHPKRLVIVPSEQAEDALNTIHDHVLEDGRLRPADIPTRVCVPTDPLSIYQIVKEELDIHGRRNGSTAGEVFIDITAGRKVMAATAAMAAWQLDVKLCYIDGDYIDGRAVPGSDRLLLLDNPSFGESAMVAAEHAFSSGAFEAAGSRFEELAKRLARPVRARFMAALSGLYGAWCDFDLVKLPAAIARVEKNLDPMRRYLSNDTLAALYTQLEYLRKLCAGNESALLLCFSVVSDHYRWVGRHDFAALYSYRTIEGCFAARLRARHQGFARRPFDYDDVGVSKPELREAYRHIVDEVRERATQASLPREPGVFSSAALLAALGDPLAELTGLSRPAEIRVLWELTDARNQSVLAHGKEPVSAEVSQRLHEHAMAVLKAFWALHHSAEDLDHLRRTLAFVRPGGDG